MTGDTKSPKIAEDVAQNAVNETGFGRFNLKIMGVCGLIYMNIGFGYGSLGLVIPSAACDFNMTTVDKSRLSVASALGMLCGAYIWGCLADVKGRKYALIVALLLHGGFDAISAVTPNYWFFISTKFFSGLGLSGQLALIFAYLGEFQPTHARNRILSWMEMAWVVGYTMVPIIGWMVIPLEFSFRTDHFFFRSWNLFMLICSFPAIMIATCLLFLPETPKYLAENGQYAELLRVLECMYMENNNKMSEEYTKKISNINDSTLNELINLAQLGDTVNRRTRSSKEIFLSFWRQTVMLLRPPYLTRSLIVGTVTTCLMSTYFPLIMWLPEVFNRFATFETLYPGERASVCTVSSALRHNVSNEMDLITIESTNSSAACAMGISDDMYLHTIILGLACIPTALWLPLFVERLGYISHLVFGSFIAAAVILGLFFVSSSLENLILSCIFESVASICITAMLCLLVELYPTNLRVMAAAFSTFIGRLGSFIGNALFGYLIDEYCVPLISVIVGQLLRLDFLADGSADFEHAITVTGFGKFHYMLLAVCGLIYMDTAIGVTIISFVLPAAACDLGMDSTSKGWLTASPMLGMVLGSYIWGCLADTKGRKVVLIATLLMDGLVGIASSFVQYFWIFLIFRFFNGFAVTGAMGICFPYLGEFQPTKYREKILCWMEMFWTIGVIALPLIAWAIVPHDFIYESETFYFKSWNLFVALCALPSLMLSLWLFAFPESPKFLLECGETDEALEVFKWIYSQNTGKDPETYPVKSLQEKPNPKDKSTRSLKLHKRKDLKVLCSEVWDLTKLLCKPPYLRNTLLACAIQFGLTSSYYTLMVWFPELFTRFEEFEESHLGESTSVCIVSALAENSTNLLISSNTGCVVNIPQSVYLHTVYIGLACIPGSIILPLFIHKVGAKVFLIVSLVIAGGVTVGFYYVTNANQNLVLSCIFEALTSLGISLVYCVIVDMFPTNLRVMAAALSLTMGRLGALVGNLLFGYLIDLACVVPVILFAAFLFACGLLSFFLPQTGKETLD